MYSLTANYPQGTGAPRWARGNRHEIDITPLNATQICRENMLIRRQCLETQHTLLLSPLNKQLSIEVVLHKHLLNIVSFYPIGEKKYFSQAACKADYCSRGQALRGEATFYTNQ